MATKHPNPKETLLQLQSEKAFNTVILKKYAAIIRSKDAEANLRRERSKAAYITLQKRGWHIITNTNI